ncbi:type II toxin-antitoxin system RelE/ParE family toxin [Natribacillus halophilus]|uniref:ParE toxin of type II toxin-antitoxin system, parDE n=1 Tax=Natribacillus halophilus TaxID=549003 RepID=A0A1G8KD31_9BACI|nr:type II toxin-antitoxin system RelE/ParE family toxin [Natribacillus halophilus]SDI41327.1 ParE toxin of type II toxin-antitoxin system, parDE [Natribacillus halophilus]
MNSDIFTVKVTPIARTDLDEDEIYNYISSCLHNQPAASDLMHKIETEIMRLQHFPFSCSYVEDKTLRNKGYRKLIVNNYIGLYLVNEVKQEVILLRFLYGKQKYEGLI